jgi:hypothetical protein
MSTPPSNLKKMLPRDGSGKIGLPAETGTITRMVGHDGFLEVYTTLATYRTETPDNLDPERKVPNMPWAKKKAADVGSANPIVARIFLQAHDAIKNATLTRGDTKTILSHLHSCKQELVSCEAA